MPKISFVLPCWNRIAWIAECIQSLIMQTEKDIEIIVVDDCSTDKSHIILDYYKKLDPRIVVHYNEVNLGAGLSRNVGNNLAQSAIIAVCDSDDYYSTDRAEKILKEFENPEIDMINTGYHRVNYSNQIVESYPGKEFDKEAFENNKEFYFCHPSAAYSKKDALLIPYKKETDLLTDDRQFVDDWIKAGKKIKLIDTFSTFHRVLPNSIMTKMRNGSLE